MSKGERVRDKAKWEGVNGKEEDRKGVFLTLYPFPLFPVLFPRCHEFRRLRSFGVEGRGEKLFGDCQGVVVVDA